MRSIIKETCGCGATLEYEEVRGGDDYVGYTDLRQESFHRAHKACRGNTESKGARSSNGSVALKSGKENKTDER